MMRHNLKLVSTQLPEVLLVHAMNDVREAWIALVLAWFLPQSWVALWLALNRYEGHRLRMLRR